MLIRFSIKKFQFEIDNINILADFKNFYTRVKQLLFRSFAISIFVLLIYSNKVLAEPNTRTIDQNIFIPIEYVNNSYIYYGEIAEGDAQVLSKLIQNNQVENLIISSPGGLVYEALDIAYLIRQNGISIFIPKDQFCLSACAFIFFAGNARVSEGKLGVHQVNFPDTAAKRIGRLGEITRDSQLVVSDIISALNSFDVPQFVYERMFATEDMYFFTGEELKKIERISNHFSETQRLSFFNNVKKLEATFTSNGKQKLSLPEVVKKFGQCLSQMGRPSIFTCF